MRQINKFMLQKKTQYIFLFSLFVRWEIYKKPLLAVVRRYLALNMIFYIKYTTAIFPFSLSDIKRKLCDCFNFYGQEKIPFNSGIAQYFSICDVQQPDKFFFLLHYFLYEMTAVSETHSLCMALPNDNNCEEVFKCNDAQKVRVKPWNYLEL